MRGLLHPTPSTFTYTFSGQFPPAQRRALLGAGRRLLEALDQLEPGGEPPNPRHEVGFVLADLLVATQHLEEFGELLADDPPPDEAPLLELAVACARGVFEAAEPLRAALTSSAEEALREEMAVGAEELRELARRLEDGEKALDHSSATGETLSGLVAFLVMKRLAPAIGDLEGTARPEEG